MPRSPDGCYDGFVNHDALSKTGSGRHEIELVLSRPEHLFNAPALDPLSQSPVEIVGISGVDYLLGQFQLCPAKAKSDTLLLYLPPGTPTPRDARSLNEALQRYTKMRIQNEISALRANRHYGLKVFTVALLLLVILLALSALFASDFTSWMPQVLRRPLEYGFEIVGWVMMWHPVEVLLFNPMSGRSKLNALRALSRMNIVVKPVTNEKLLPR
jgi:hypothetical protein